MSFKKPRSFKIQFKLFSTSYRHDNYYQNQFRQCACVSAVNFIKHFPPAQKVSHLYFVSKAFEFFSSIM